MIAEDFNSGSSRLRPPSGANGLYLGIYEFVMIPRFSPEIGYFDDDGAAPGRPRARTIHFAHDLLRRQVVLFVRVTLNAGHGYSAVNIPELFAQVDALDGDVGAAFPGPAHRFERDNLQIRASLVSVEPRTGVVSATALHFAIRGTLTPTALELFIQREAFSAVIRHFFASVDQHVNVVGVVQGLRSAPDDREGGANVGRPRRVRELHFVAIDDVSQELRVDGRHAAFDVELTHEAGLNNERGDVVHFNADFLLDARRDEYFRISHGGRIDSGAISGSGTDRRADPFDSGDQDIVAAVFGRVVSAAMAVDAPIAGERRRHAGSAGGKGVAVEKGEIGGHQIGSFVHLHGQNRGEMVLRG